MKRQHIINIIAVLFTAFILFIIFSANTGRSLAFFHIKELPMGDKIAHASLIGMLAFILNLAMRGKSFWKWNREWLTVSFWLTIIITMEEFSQAFIPTRSFDLLDLAANYFGIAVASWLIITMKRRKILVNT